MILKFFLIPIIAGSIATAGITAFMWLVNKSGLANADMVRAVGSLFTRSREDALKIGLIIHFLAGIIISTFYLLVLTMLPLTTPLETVAVGGIIGFIHGFAFSFFSGHSCRKPSLTGVSASRLSGGGSPYFGACGVWIAHRRHAGGFGKQRAGIQWTC
jgi:hypothetical protein